MSKKNWLTDRLTDLRKEKPIWLDFVSALQDLISNHAEQYISRLKRKVSLFDADKEDLDRMLMELGDFFALGNVDDHNLPLVIMQRQDQIHQKKTIYPLVNTLVREFGGIRVTWEALYAPIDQETYPYGDLLVIEREIDETGIPRDQWFMTSRGVIRVPMLEVRRTFGSDGISDSDSAVSAFEELLRRVVYPLIPMRIVCDGQQYYLSFDLVEIMEWLTHSHSGIETSVPFFIEREESNAHKIGSVVTKAPTMDHAREAIVDREQNRIDGHRMDAIGMDRFVWTQYVYSFLNDNYDGMKFIEPIALSDGCRVEFEFILGAGGWNRYIFDGRTMDDDDFDNGWLYFHHENGKNTNVRGNWLVYKNGEESTFQSLAEGDHVKVINGSVGGNFRISTVGNRFTWDESLNCQWLRMSVSNSADPQNNCEISFIHTDLSIPYSVDSFVDENGGNKIVIRRYDSMNWSAFYRF